MVRHFLLFFTASRLARFAPLLTLVYLMGLVFVLLYPFHFSLPGPHKPFLSFNMLNTEGVPFLVRNSDSIDVIANIILFIPLGGFLFAWLKRPDHSSALTFLFTVIAASLVSVVCEALQVFEPARDSAIFDVCSNGMGAAVGATSCWGLFSIVEKFRKTGNLVY